MIRYSPTSLLLTGSRSSSTSGSYGHLSAGAASPALLHSAALQSAHLQQLQQLQNHIHELRRSAELRSSPFLSPGNSLLHSSPALHSNQTNTGTAGAAAGYFPVFGTSGSPFTPVAKDSKEPLNTSKPESSSNVVSSTIDDDDKTGIKLEEGVSKEDGEGREEPDFIETHCHWRDCDRDYGTQDDLVKVSHKGAVPSNLQKIIVSCFQINGRVAFKGKLSVYLLFIFNNSKIGDWPSGDPPLTKLYSFYKVLSNKLLPWHALTLFPTNQSVLVTTTDPQPALLRRTAFKSLQVNLSAADTYLSRSNIWFYLGSLITTTNKSSTKYIHLDKQKISYRPFQPKKVIFPLVSSSSNWCLALYLH